MKPLTVAEIRERYLRFFEARGHKRLRSDSLVPENDPTLLFTGAGMNQFKDMFLGKGKLPYRRITTAQKCLRVPDLDNVGLTPRHHTFFEMLGNFSFGDYFKQECIAWEWEFFSKELGIPERQMVVTVYADDDEAFTIWNKHIGLPLERIFRFGEKENFWPAEAPSKGPNGPCGPCSEIYFDSAPDRPYPQQLGLTSLPDDRFTEIGNCVFTQFDRRADGTLVPLPQKNIDVGLGLERIAAVLAGAPNNFETDIFRPLLNWVGQRSGKRYRDNAEQDVRMRRIADHVRAVVFCISDGALPSNEGRGYVVRKILRRAARDGYELGIADPFLWQMVDIVGELMGDAYPEIREHAGQCRSLIRSEEEGFSTVYRQGLLKLREFLGGVAAKPGERQPVLGSGEFAFLLHDTYGFPSDITRQVMAERGLVMDEAGFERAMDAQRERARSARSTEGAVFAENAAMALRVNGVPPTRFIGYSQLTCASAVAALVGPNNALCDAASSGEILVVTEVTPFYAEGGGQVGDRGSIETESGGARVLTTTAMDGFHLHRAEIIRGSLRRGQPCRLSVDSQARSATERNHTATHLLHAALKRVVGAHVNQAGSLVTPERLRFDFTHGEKLSAEQLAAIEELVNESIMAATAVEACVRPMAEARAAGFVALFGEKYGDQVRTLAVGEFSKELCGGTHVANSGHIGLFRITAEVAISSGTRRIEAVTGKNALAVVNEERRQLGDVAGLLKVPPREVFARVSQLSEESKALRKQLEKALAPDPDSLLVEIEKGVFCVGAVRCAILQRRGINQKQAQEILVRARQKLSPFAGVVLSEGSDHVAVVAVVSPEVASSVPASDLVAAAVDVMGGGGGGRHEIAQGRGKDAAHIGAAAQAIRGRLARASVASSC